MKTMQKRQFCIDDQLIKLVLTKNSKSVPRIPLFRLQPGGDNVMTVSSLHTKLQIGNFQRFERGPVSQQLYCTTVLLQVLYCKIKNVFFKKKLISLGDRS